MLFFSFLKSNFALHKTSRITKFPCNMDEILQIFCISSQIFIIHFFNIQKLYKNNPKKIKANVTRIQRSRTKRSGIELKINFGEINVKWACVQRKDGHVTATSASHAIVFVVTSLTSRIFAFCEHRNYLLLVKNLNKCFFIRNI